MNAFKFANTFHQECMRPMSQGILNPRQQISGMMVGELEALPGHNSRAHHLYPLKLAPCPKGH